MTVAQPTTLSEVPSQSCPQEERQRWAVGDLALPNQVLHLGDRQDFDRRDCFMLIGPADRADPREIQLMGLIEASSRRMQFAQIDELAGIGADFLQQFAPGFVCSGADAGKGAARCLEMPAAGAVFI